LNNPQVAAAMKEMFLKRKKGAGVHPGCTEAVVCAGQLAQYLGVPWESHAAELVDPLFHTGLTPMLVTTLAQMSSHLPGLTAGIRERLLESIHQILAKRTWRHTSGAVADSAKAVVALGFSGGGGGTMTSVSEGGGGGGGGGRDGSEGLVRLALRTLATFDLDHPSMLAFMADCAVRFVKP